MTDEEFARLHKMQREEYDALGITPEDLGSAPNDDMAATIIARLARYKEDYGIILQASRDKDELIKELLAENARLKSIVRHQCPHLGRQHYEGGWTCPTCGETAALAAAQPSTGGE